MPEIFLPDGGRLHYLDLNPSGEHAVLLLHGLGATGESWLLQTPALTRPGIEPLLPTHQALGGQRARRGQ